MTAGRVTFHAIGTKWDIHVDDRVDADSWARLLHRIDARIERFDNVYSRFRADSLVTKMSQKTGSYKMPPDAYKMLDFYHQLYKATHGNVTPLIGQTMVEAGYDASYSLQKKTLHRPPKWEDVMQYDRHSLVMQQPFLLDFGAAGKGYLVDIVGQMLEEAGIQTYTINAGGDIRYRSAHKEGLPVGLENPVDTSEAIGITTLMNASLCASAGSKRKWDDLSHTINPHTLKSPTDIIATWVIATDTMTADGLATALFFTEPRELMGRFSFSYALLHKDMSLEYFKDFPVMIFEAT